MQYVHSIIRCNLFNCNSPRYFPCNTVSTGSMPSTEATPRPEPGHPIRLEADPPALSSEARRAFGLGTYLPPAETSKQAIGALLPCLLLWPANYISIYLTLSSPRSERAPFRVRQKKLPNSWDRTDISKNLFLRSYYLFIALKLYISLFNSKQGSHRSLAETEWRLIQHRFRAARLSAW